MQDQTASKPIEGHNFTEMLNAEIAEFEDQKDTSVLDHYFDLLYIDPYDNRTPDEQAVYLELNWLLQVIRYRCLSPQEKSGIEDLLVHEIEMPSLPTESHYGQWVNTQGLNVQDRILLALTMSASINDAILYPFIELSRNPLVAPFIGGQTQANGKRFIASLQTLLYLLGGTDLHVQAQYQMYFRSRQHQLAKWGIDIKSFQAMRTGYSDITDEWKNLVVNLQPAFWRYFMGGEMPKPEENQQLPLTLLESKMNFADLVLPTHVVDQLKPVIAFAQRGQEFITDQSMGGHFKSGYVVLLHGDPGTGKTLIATTIGQHTGLKTYQLDVSQVVSKYIGETSKNMGKVFDELERAISWAEGEQCILFIDEADAIMGKRSEVSDSKDRYANLDVSFLLQRLEQFSGLVILASNYPQNLDDAFSRRIQTQIMVTAPNVQERERLWEIYRPAGINWPDGQLVEQMSKHFALTGAQIANIMKQASLMAFAADEHTFQFSEHIEPFVKSEYQKMQRGYHGLPMIMKPQAQ
ncbi:MAG: ATP-binding protein [Bacteroidota bacterium]